MALQGTYEPSPTRWVREQVAEFEASNGARANMLARTGDPIVVITSVGATSGKLRKNPVMRVEHEGRYLAVASYGGRPEDPVWADNFRAHPEVDLQDGPDKATYDRARAARRTRARRVVGARGRDLVDVRRVPEEDRPADPALPARAHRLTARR